MMDEVRTVVEKEYDFFIYSTSDSCNIGLRVATDLERFPFRCLKSWDHRAGNRQWLEELHKDVQRSCWTLICFEQGEPGEVCHTLMAGLVKEEFPTILFVMTPDSFNTLENCSWAKTGQIPSIQRVIIDFNRQDYIKQILNACSTSKEAVGCLAHGQVFSHFIGYWSHILPDLKEEIEKLSTFKDNLGRMSTKLYVMLPNSAHMEGSLETESPTTGTRIIPTGEKLEMTAVHAGKGRIYHSTVYEVSKGSQSFYCIVDIPDVLKLIYLMGKHQIEGVQVESEMLRFYYTVSMLLNHTQCSYPDRVRLLLYNEKAANKEDVLFDAVRSDVAGYVSSNRQIQPPDRLLSRSPSQNEYQHQVAVMCDPDEHEDGAIAEDIEEYLNSKKVDTFHSPKGPLTELEHSKWHIFIISRQSIEGYHMPFICRSSLSCDKIHAIIILRGVMPYELPPEMKWAFVLSVSEPRYMEKLLKAMDGEPVKLEDSLPTGDVATGLAWGYAVRYLNLTLGMGKKRPQAFTERITEFCHAESAKIGQGCVKRFYSLCPRSCTTTNTDLVTEVNKGNSQRRHVEQIGTLREYRYKDRPYKLHVYRYTNLNCNKILCFVCEYNTPLNCLSEMANCNFSGLLKEDMYRQRERFVQLLPDILANPQVKEEFGDFSDIVQLVDFDDETECLMDVLEKLLLDPSVPIVSV